MIEVATASPNADVADAEYQRLLGYPRDWVLEDRARELAAAARAWYAAHGRPWVYARRAKHCEITSGSVRLDGVSFQSERLRAMLLEAEADSAILVAVSAGPELEREAQRLWSEE